MDDLISEFISETTESLEALDRELGTLQQHPADAAVLGSIARLMHTIKATCAFAPLPRIEVLASAVAHRLAAIQQGTIKSTAQNVAPVLRAIEQMKGLLEALASDGEEPRGDDRALLAELTRMAGEALETAAPAASFAETLDAVMVVEPPEKPAPPSQGLTRSVAARVPRLADMGAAVLQMATGLVDTRNQLLAIMRRSGNKELEAPVRQLTQMIGELQQQIGPGLIDDKAITRVLVMEAAGQKFALAQAEVLELVRIGDGAPHQVEMVSDASLLRLRDRLLPVMGLREILQLSVRHQRGMLNGYAVMLRVGGIDFGIVVDALNEAEEVVIHPMPKLIGTLGMYRGMAVLGDGSIVLQLDAHGLALDFGARGGAYRPSDYVEAAQVDYLMFHAGARPHAVPLSQVVRLETFDLRAVKGEGAVRYVNYRGEPLPLHVLPTMPLPHNNSVSAIVLQHAGESFALAVEQVADIVTAPELQMRTAREPYYLGSTLMDGDMVDVLDLAFLASHRREEV